MKWTLKIEVRDMLTEEELFYSESGGFEGSEHGVAVFAQEMSGLYVDLTRERHPKKNAVVSWTALSTDPGVVQMSGRLRVKPDRLPPFGDAPPEQPSGQTETRAPQQE